MRELSSKYWSLLAVILGLLGCTSKPEGRMPEEKVMHFPLTMALSPDKQTLLVAGSAADGKYDFGRLVSLKTSTIKKVLESNNAKDPIDWSSVVETNVLIPQDVGEISYSDNFIIMASRQNNRIIAMPTTGGGLSCSGTDTKAEDCPAAKSLELSHDDPFALAVIESAANKDTLLVSYLSSDHIDVVTVDGNAIAITKGFNAFDWLKTKLSAESLKNRRLITRKIAVTFKNDLTRSKAYFLLEEHPLKSQTVTRAKALHLLAISVRDLVGRDPIGDTMVELWNLSDQFSIAGGQDFFIDEVNNHAIVLARVPEALFKIDLTKKELIDTTVVCTGALSMATAKNSLVVPCFTDNRIGQYTMSPLRFNQASAQVGRGPSYCVIDETHGLIYCTYYKDGTLVLFDNKFNYLGSVFPKAPKYRTGS